MIFSIDEIRERVLPIIEKYHIPAMYLFGSYARGDANEDSDIDFLVDTTGTELTSLIRLGSLLCDLEDTFGKRIDLITVRAITQKSTMPSSNEFHTTVWREKVKLNDVA